MQIASNQFPSGFSLVVSKAQHSLVQLVLHVTRSSPSSGRRPLPLSHFEGSGERPSAASLAHTDPRRTKEATDTFLATLPTSFT